MRATVVIPARLRSSRLTNKVLVDIAGQTMLRRSHDLAVASDVGPVVVLTDAEEVAAEVRSFGGTVLLTDPALESGTARIASAIDALDAEVIVNLQGDAPLTDPGVVARSAAEAAAAGAEVTMPVYRMTEAQDVADPNVVKVLRDGSGRTLYCSRSSVPHVRGTPPDGWPQAATFWGHVGIYAYSRAFLTGFGELPPSPLEDAERLEQLRWIEAGIAIHTFEVPAQGPSVDTQLQLERVRASFLERERSAIGQPA